MARTYVRRSCAWVGAALVLASCDDRGSVVAPPSETQPLISTDGSRGLQIDSADTWLSVDVEMQSVSTVNSSTAFVDPTTGNQTTTMTVTSPEENMTLAGGYDAGGVFQGSLVVGLDPDPNANPADQVKQTVFSGETVTNYNGYGQVMGNTLSDGSAVPSVVSEDLFYTEGEMLDGVVIEDPIVFSRTDPYGTGSGGGGGGGGGGGTPIEPQLMTAMLPGEGGGSRRVERPDEGTVVVTDELDESMITGGDAAPSGASFSRAAAATASVLPIQSSGKTRMARTFKRRGKEFVLESIRLEREDVTAEGSARHVQTMRYKNVRWHRNAQKDKQRLDRRNARAQAAPRSPSSPRSVIMQPVDNCTDYEYTINTNCGGGDPYYPPPPTYTPPPTEWGSRTAAGRYVVFQHGFAQDQYYYYNSRAWDEVENNRYVIAGADATETNYGAIFQDQASQLAAQVPQRKAIYVGHSNGGIVSRQLSRQRPDLVEGIVTVSSPHRGVPILRVEQGLSQMVGPFFFVINTVGCKWFGSNSVCRYFDNGPSALFSRIVGGDGRPVPVWGQERWSDFYRGPYLYNLNNQAESFPRVGIEQHTRQRWLFWRVLGDQNFHCNGAPCGRVKVADMDKWYGGLRAATVVRWTWNPFKMAGRIARAAVAGTVMIGVNAFDGAVVVALGAGDKSDGLVPYGSQRYPNQSGPPVIVPNADSHNASAYSPPAVDALRLTLRDRLGVQTRY